MSKGGGCGAPHSSLPWPPWHNGKRRRMFADEENKEERDEDRIKTIKSEDSVPPPDNEATINELPDEVLLIMFQYLDPFTLVNSASKVCQRWHELAWDESPWRSMHLQLDGPEAKDILLKAPALRRLTIHSYGGYEPLLECTTRIFELVITDRRLFDEPEPVPPLEESHFAFSEVLPRFSETLERMTVEVDLTEEEFKVIDDNLDLKELRLVSNNLQNFTLCERYRNRFLEYAHFEREGSLCNLPMSVLDTHGPYLRTLVGRVDEVSAQCLSKCESLETADLDLPSVASLQNLDCLQNLHTLRISFRVEIVEEDRVEYRDEDRINPILPHFSQRLLHLSIDQFPTAFVLTKSFLDILNRYKDHLQSLEIGRVFFRNQFHGIQIMRVIDEMPCLKLLGMGLAGWPAYPLSPPCLEVLKADMFSEWVVSVLESSRKTLRKVMVQEIPEIVVEQFLSNCENLDECIISFSALQYLNKMEHLQNLTLQIPGSVRERLFDSCSPVLSRITNLQAEGKGGDNDNGLLMMLGDRCTALKRLTLRGWGREVGKGLWMRSFRNVEFLSLDLAYQFRRSLVLRLVMGHMPKLRVLCLEDQEGEHGTISDLEKLHNMRPELRIEGSWKESVSFDYNRLGVVHHW